MREQQIYVKELEPVAEDLRNLRAKEDGQLHSYQYIDRARGTVRIPIERAMELLEEEYAEGRLSYPTKPAPVKVEPPQGGRKCESTASSTAFRLWLLATALTLHAEQPARRTRGRGHSGTARRADRPEPHLHGEDGYQVPLKQYFHKGQPVLLNLVYYPCPMLCNLMLNGQTSTLREIPWTPGKEFEIVTISIDPTETFELAAQKKAAYLASYERPAPGWHFLADHDGNAKKLADQVGFHYRYDDQTGQYAHAAVIMFLTPEGKVSRYLYGIQFKARDLRLALTEASQAKFGLSVDRLLLYCFHYDPQARGYVLFATNVMRGGGVLTVLILGFVLWRMWRFEKRLAAAGVAAR